MPRRKGSKNKPSVNNIKVISIKDHHMYKDVDELVEKGKDKRTGKFVKGNNCATIGKVKARIAADIAASCSDDEAATRLRDLLYSKNENVALKALTVWLAYRHGKPVQMIQSENQHQVSSDDLPDDLASLIKNIDMAVNDDFKCEANDDCDID